MHVEHAYPDFTINLYTYICRMLGDYRLLEHERADWLPIASLDPELWAPADRPIIEALQADYANG
jgi:hypothetical protein